MRVECKFSIIVKGVIENSQRGLAALEVIITR